METQVNPPPYLGGQGRTAHDVEALGDVLLVVALGILVGILAYCVLA